ncbi:ABC transporter permease [Azorhizobium oxalatiphilum]|uniref:ABC transporter permease n=1 Tax=Azorhizobium oxalatiphilum TaxID=980631 RepID=A0A917BY29_9HYPH|nr:amino acid ABC transporter permease [Azorhizobium oxalatiphilum]GGF62939.1 ABC transporter permease [Azorhizobium oxalatiphilum]
MKYKFDFGALAEYWPQFVDGALLTLEMTVLSTVSGLVVGTLVAIGRRSENKLLSRLCGAYVETVRNTPFLIQLFFIYFGLASAGLRLPVVVASVIAMVFNVAAYTAEIVRAGMDATPRGQLEAADSLGMSLPQIYWHIILRPALERVYPALTGQYILMMLSTSVTSQISAEELTGIANNIQSNTFRSFETFIVVAGIYLLLTLILKAGFWGLGLALFTRRRRLGTSL